jgi:hypothetical protein
MSSLTFTDTDYPGLQAQSYGYTNGTGYTATTVNCDMASILPAGFGSFSVSTPSAVPPEPSEFAWLRNRIKEVLWNP